MSKIPFESFRFVSCKVQEGMNVLQWDIVPSRPIPKTSRSHLLSRSTARAHSPRSWSLSHKTLKTSPTGAAFHVTHLSIFSHVRLSTMYCLYFSHLILPNRSRSRWVDLRSLWLNDARRRMHPRAAPRAAPVLDATSPSPPQTAPYTPPRDISAI